MSMNFIWFRYLVIVGNKVKQGKTIMCNDKVDTMIRLPLIHLLNNF